MMRGFRVSKLIYFNISDYLPHSCHQSISRSFQAVPPLMMRLLCSYNSTDGDEDGDRTPEGLSSSGRSPHRPSSSLSATGLTDGGDANLYRYRKENGRNYNSNKQNFLDRPGGQAEGLSGGRKFDCGLEGKRDFDHSSGRYGSDATYHANQNLNYYDNKPKPTTRVVGGVNHTDSWQSRVGKNTFPFANEEKPQISPSHKGKMQQQGDDGFLEKFKLGFDQVNKQTLSNDLSCSSREGEGEGGSETKVAATAPEPPPLQDTDEIFKKMKETGLIPNAVAMLHGLCNDGLVQEAMKLFGLMREKGTMPEVVIYTAVVEGFCNAHKLDDAMRIFQKMQNNGISANAFSYAVLVQGLCKGKRLDDALEFCVEMLEVGHSPNLATFTGLVDGFCRERGLEASQVMIGLLRQKGFFFDEKAARDFLDKKGPFLPMVWEAILGKKSSQRFF